MVDMAILMIRIVILPYKKGVLEMKKCLRLDNK